MTTTTNASRAGLRGLGTLVALAAIMTAPTVDAAAQQPPAGRSCELGEDCPLQLPSAPAGGTDPEGTGNSKGFGPERVPGGVLNRNRGVRTNPNVVIDPAEANGFTGAVTTVRGVPASDPEGAEGTGNQKGISVERALQSPAAAKRLAGPVNPHVATDPGDSGGEPGSATGSPVVDDIVGEIVGSLVAHGVPLESGDVITLNELAYFAQNAELVNEIKRGEVDGGTELEIDILPGANPQSTPGAVDLSNNIPAEVTTADGGKALLYRNARVGPDRPMQELAPDSGLAPVPDGLASGDVRAVAAYLAAGIVRPAFAPATVAGAAPSELGDALRRTLRDPQTVTGAPSATAPPQPEVGTVSPPAAARQAAIGFAQPSSQAKTGDEAGRLIRRLAQRMAGCATRGRGCTSR